MPKDAPKLCKVIMAALDRVTNGPDPGVRFSALGCLQAKACPPGSFLCEGIAVRPIRLQSLQGARVQARDAHFWCRRVDYQGPEYRFGLTAIVGLGSPHHHSEWHGASVTGEVERRPTFAAIHGAGPCLLAPFLAGFLKPSTNTSSQLIPLQGVIPLGQLLPGVLKGILGQPHFESPLHRLIGGKPCWQHAPPEARHQHI